MKRHIIIWILFFLMILFIRPTRLDAQKVLFKSHFSDIKEVWEILDDPKAKNLPSNWRYGMVELSGIHNRDNNVATVLLAGEKDWKNYTIETSFHVSARQGYLVGLICGYQDPNHFLIVGYNFHHSRFEFVARTPDGFDILVSFKIDFPEKVDVPLRLDYAGERLIFTANGRLFFPNFLTSIMSLIIQLLFL